MSRDDGLTNPKIEEMLELIITISQPLQRYKQTKQIADLDQVKRGCSRLFTVIKDLQSRASFQTLSPKLCDYFLFLAELYSYFEPEQRQQLKSFYSWVGQMLSKPQPAANSDIILKSFPFKLLKNLRRSALTLFILMLVLLAVNLSLPLFVLSNPIVIGCISALLSINVIAVFWIKEKIKNDQIQLSSHLGKTLIGSGKRLASFLGRSPALLRPRAPRKIIKPEVQAGSYLRTNAPPATPISGFASRDKLPKPLPTPRPMPQAASVTASVTPPPRMSFSEGLLRTVASSPPIQMRSPGGGGAFTPTPRRHTAGTSDGTGITGPIAFFVAAQGSPVARASSRVIKPPIVPGLAMGATDI